jgi:hypothetical protein
MGFLSNGPIKMKDESWRVGAFCGESAIEGKWRCRLYMGDGMTREFDKTNLPDLIKSRLAYINAYDWDVIHRTSGIDDDEASRIIWSFKTVYPQELIDIGWRYKNRYCFVVPDSFYREMRGKKVDDTRGESQSEGKENS